MTQDGTIIWLLAVAVFVFILWLIHLVLCIREWQAHRSARTFQGAYIALMIQAGMTSIVLSRAVRTWPEATWLVAAATWVAPILTWMLLSGAVVALWAWRAPRRRQGRTKR